MSDSAVPKTGTGTGTGERWIGLLILFQAVTGNHGGPPQHWSMALKSGSSIEALPRTKRMYSLPEVDPSLRKGQCTEVVTPLKQPGAVESNLSDSQWLGMPPSCERTVIVPSYMKCKPNLSPPLVVLVGLGRILTNVVNGPVRVPW